jgi:hypothetical protein
MHVKRSIGEPIRDRNLPFEERWEGPDQGLIAAWERGREMSREDPQLAAQALAGRLVELPWKGGVKEPLKKKHKFGTLWYLAMWQGLRGEDLDVDMEAEVSMTCPEMGLKVTYTPDFEKYKKA